MIDLKINNTILSFDTVYYCDSVNGNNNFSGLTENSPLQDIQTAINKAAVNTNVAIVLLPNSVFEGALNDIGFIHIHENKQITFIGKLFENNVNTMPIIRSTEYNCIQNNSLKEINFINIRIESYGTQFFGGSDSYATLYYSPGGNSIINFYNCYLMPRGIMFLNRGNITVYNSIIDYNKHNFLYEIAYTSSAVYRSKLFYNCVILDTITCRTSHESDTLFFYNSIVPNVNLSLHNFTSSTNKRIETSLSTIDSDLKITLDPSYYLSQGTGLNPDGSIANIGLYGGEFAISERWSFKYLIYHNNTIKYFDIDIDTWIDTGTTILTEQLFQDYGNSNINILLENLSNLGGKFKLYAYNKDIEITDCNLTIQVIPQPKIITQIEDIFLNDVETIQNIDINGSVGADNVVKVLTSGDKGNTWHYFDFANNTWIESTDIKTDGNTLTDISNIKTYFSSLCTDTIRFKYYIELNDLTQNAKVSDINLLIDLKGHWTYNANVFASYTIDFVSPTSCKVTITEEGTYKINY